MFSHTDRRATRMFYRANSFAGHPHQRPLLSAVLRTGTPPPSRRCRDQQNMELVRFARSLREQSRLTSSDHQALGDIAGLFCSLQTDMMEYEQHILTASQALIGLKTYFNELEPKLQALQMKQLQQKAEVDEVSNIIVQLQKQYCGEREIQRLTRCQQHGRRLAEKAWYDTGIYGRMSHDYATFVLDRFQDRHQQYGLRHLKDDFREVGKTLSILEAEAKEMEWTISIVAEAAERVAHNALQDPQGRRWRALEARLDALDDWFNEDDGGQSNSDQHLHTTDTHGHQHLAPRSEMATGSNTPDHADRVRPEDENELDHNRDQGSDRRREADISEVETQKEEATAEGSAPLDGPRMTPFSAVEDQITRRGHARHSTNYAAAATGPPQLGSVVRRNGRSVPRIFTGSFDELEEGLQRLRASAANTSGGSAVDLTASAGRLQGQPSVSVRDFATPENGTPTSSMPSTPTIYLVRPGANNRNRDAARIRRPSDRAQINSGEAIRNNSSGIVPSRGPDPPSSAPPYVSTVGSFAERSTGASSQSRRPRQREHTL